MPKLQILGPNGQPFRREVGADSRAVRARYDAAQTTAENSKHWANADGLSARMANDPVTRYRLRIRARYERDCNSYCSGMAESIANDTIGTGPRLQLQTKNRNLNERVSSAFEEWTAAIGLAEKLRTFREARCIDGESFLFLATNPRLSTPVKLDLREVEADQVATPDLWISDEYAVDGIRYDRHGNPVEYHVLKYHPGDMSTSGVAWGEYDRIPAANVLHWFKRRRPGQCRGVPEVTPALPLYAILRRYTLATLSAAEIAALFAVLLKTTMPPDDSTPAVTPFDTQELARGMMAALPEGYEAQQMKPEHPATTYDQFERAVLRQIARCLHIPLSIAAGDSADLNYSSGRLDHQNYHRMIGVDRYFLETGILDRVFREWLWEASLDRAGRRIVAGLDPSVMPPRRWGWDGFKHVDPLKEAEASAVRLQNGTSTMDIECAEDGNDWREIARQRAEERAYYAELGIPYPGEAAPATSGDQQPDDGTDEDPGQPARSGRAALNGRRNGAIHRG